MAETNKGQHDNQDQVCYTNESTAEEAAESFRSFIRDPRTLFKPAPQMPDPVRGLSDNLDQLCYPSQAPISLDAFIDDGGSPPLPEFTFPTNLGGLCKWIPELCDKLPTEFTMNFNGTKPCLVANGGDGCFDPTGGYETNKCIQDAIECIFKPYSQPGGWLPTATDPDTFVPPGFNRNKDNLTCVANCVPERIAVYEWIWAGTDRADYYYTIDPDETPAGYVRSRPSSVGGAVRAIAISTKQSNGYYQAGDWQAMTIDQTYRNEAGARWWPNLTDKKFETEFKLGSKGGKVKLIVAAIRERRDWDTKYVFQGISKGGDGYTIGETFEIRTPDDSVLLGYVQVTDAGSQSPAFWILKSIAQGAVPLYHYFSSKYQDSFLTTNVSAEINKIVAGEYTLRGIIGYVFINSEKSDKFLCEAEVMYPLYRYYQDASTGQKQLDHKYSIIPLNSNEPLKVKEKQLVYPIPDKAFSPLVIRYKSQRGSAGKKSSFGYYLTDEKGDPQIGYILRKNMTDSAGHGQISIPVNTLNSYARGKLGFFIIAGGNADGNISDGSTVTFTKVTLSSGVGYQAYKNGTLVYARSGQPGNWAGGQNYIFFSDTELNPKNKCYTKWSGKMQGWEDWEGGDQDFDDVKIYYNVKWENQSNYISEGVQCYVYENDRLPALYMTTLARVGCEADRLFKTAFKDPIIKRIGCGSSVDGTVYSGTCTGEYVVQSNCDQSINVYMDGNISIRAWGCDATGDDKETSWRMIVTVNNRYILDEIYSVATFPRKGRTLHPAFDVFVGDVIRFQLTEVLTGSPNGVIFPKISFYDEKNNIHESVLNMTVSTKSLDSVSYTVPGGSNTGITQVRISDIETDTNVIGWQNNATLNSLIIPTGDKLWRKISKTDRENVNYQRSSFQFKRTNIGVSGGYDAAMQVRIEPLLNTVTNRYDTKVTIEQMLFKGKGFGVGETLVIEFPKTMYYGTKRIPNNQKVKFKFTVTGVG